MMNTDPAVIESVASDQTEEGLVPIREISRATGINTVTLRAWERRYGLLIPQRTAKGHRLYSLADISRVKEIQVWLGRGVAISKIKALLTGQPQEHSVAEIDSIWLSLIDQIHIQINAFHRGRLVHILADTYALYPAEMVADYLLVPLINSLQANEFGMVAKRSFFASVLQEYLYAAIYRQRQPLGQSKILLVSLSQDGNDLLPLALSYSLLVHQYHAEYLGALELNEARLCAEVLQAKIVVLISSPNVNTGELQLHLKAWRDKNAIPVVLAGGLATVYPALGLREDSDVYPCATLELVHTAINLLVKG